MHFAVAQRGEEAVLRLTAFEIRLIEHAMRSQCTSPHVTKDDMRVWRSILNVMIAGNLVPIVDLAEKNANSTARRRTVESGVCPPASSSPAEAPNHQLARL